MAEPSEVPDRPGWILAMERELRNASHRTVVIVMTAFVEEALRELVEENLQPVPNKKNFGTKNFGGLVDLALRSRTVDLHLHRGLDTIRKLRNLAAHYSGEFDFDAPESNEKKLLQQLTEKLPVVMFGEPYADPSLTFLNRAANLATLFSMTVEKLNAERDKTPSDLTVSIFSGPNGGNSWGFCVLPTAPTEWGSWAPFEQ